MKILKKRETLLENMAFMGIVAAILVIINAFIALSDMFLPVIALVLSLVLPILVTLVEVSCKDRYYPIFFATTILLSLIVTLWNVEATFYYLIPSLVSGYIFGLFIKKKFPLVYGIFIASLIQGLLIYAFSRLVVVLFEIDSIETMLKILQLGESVGAHQIVFLVIYGFALIEMSFVSLIISFEIERFELSFNDDVGNELYIDIMLFILAGFIAIAYFVSLRVAYLLLGCAFYFLIILFINAIKDKKILLPILYGISVVISIILFIVLNQYLKEYSGFLLFGAAGLIIPLINLLFILLKKRNN